MTGEIIVAEKPTKKHAGKKPSPGGGALPPDAPPPGDGTEWTTFRIFAQDGDELGDLAKEARLTIAEMYHQLLAPIVKEQLIVKMREKLRKLEGK